MTNDLKRRVFEHKTGKHNGFTKKYNCYELVYFEEYSLVEEAIAREKTLKKFKRDWKFQLIKSINPNFVDLSEEW